MTGGGASASATAFSSSDFNASEYFQYRPRYPAELFDLIYSYHETTSDSFTTAIDLACGCGNGTFPLAKRFDSVIGIEPSDGMLNVANSLKNQDYRQIFHLPKLDADQSKNGKVEFQKGFAEKIDLKDQSVDLILSTVGANWFDWFATEDKDENLVWKEFSRVLKPKGSVALVGYWNWISRDYPLLNSMCYHSLPHPSGKDGGSDSGKKSRAATAMEIVHSFYDVIPDPPDSDFDSERTLRLKFDLSKAQECDPSIKDRITRPLDEIPEYMEKILSKTETHHHHLLKNGFSRKQVESSNGELKIESIQTPLRKKMKLSELVSSYRTQSVYINYYNSHPEEKEKIPSRQDLLWRSAKKAQVEQAILDAEKDGLKLNRGDGGLEKYLWDWEKECEVIYPMVILLAKKK